MIEVCAQARTGDGWRGHPESDVVLFSFGPIETATALAEGATPPWTLPVRWPRSTRTGCSRAGTPPP